MKMTMFRKTMLQVAVLALGIVALSALPVMAQDPAPRRHRRVRPVHSMDTADREE